MIKRLLIVWAMLFFTALISRAQLRAHRFEELDSLQKISPKPVLVFIQTSWCRYCAQMKLSTLKNKQVIQLLNNSFYFISFNAEQKEPIYFVNNRFNYVPTGKGTGYHELAEELATINGTIAYPTVCLLNAKNDIIYQYSGLLTSAEMQRLLKKILQHKK